MRVVVVGAGLAGLRTAEHLRAGGADVAVLEGGQRPGGRVRTVRAPFAGGQYSESGAEWVDTYHRRVYELMERYGVRPLGQGEQWTTIRRWLHRDGRLWAREALAAAEPGLFEQLDHFERLVHEAAAGVADSAAPQLHPEAAALDARSLADVAREAGLGEIGTLLQRRDSQGEFASEPAEVSLLFMAQQRAHQRDAEAGGEVFAHRVDGGFSRLAEGLAAELGELVRYGHTVTGLEQDADSVRVHANGTVHHADHVVLACSLVPVRAMALAPEMPADLHAAVHGLGYGAITKTSVQWPARTWPAGYATTAGLAQRVYEPTMNQAGEQGILMAYCGGDGGRSWAALPETERIALARSEMQAMHSIAAAPLGGYSRAWSTEARYGGSYAVYRPGEVTAYWEVLRRPWGRVHLAGEHVATCTGYMEGALESGETVAARILASG